VGPDFIAFEASTERDPDGSRLRDVLNAHFALERARQLRAVLVHWLAAFSLLVWLAAVRPGWPSVETNRGLLAGWALSALAATVAIVREWRWRVRLGSRAADIGAELPRNP
jgi:hypothetical protein